MDLLLYGAAFVNVLLHYSAKEILIFSEALYGFGSFKTMYTVDHTNALKPCTSQCETTKRKL
jgi:hypothetical protein